ncbi:AMP-binding protein [Streptomyces sp. HMX112]|uniref:AMP-binding protein n=1 Tax=Streptomyces sp. HMX112 TaxID=3390850 RepID=UPI003A7FF30F
MSDAWNDLVHGERWRSSRTLWVEDDVEYGWEQVGELASAVEEAIREHGPARVVRIRSGTKLGCFAGQLGAWRAGCVAVVDDGNLGPGEIDRVRPDLALGVSGGRSPAVGPAERSPERLPPERVPEEVVAVNFTSGSTGSRKAVAVTRGNLLALFGCRGLDVPVSDTPTAGSFATPTYDGWWFDTWRTAADGGTVVCLPHVNEDVFAWPELAEKYRIDRLLLPAAVIATVVGAVPACLAGIPWVFSGGEQFQVSTYRQARQAGLTNRFVNLYGPTEATFATHKYDLPADFTGGTVPIGTPLDGCEQSLYELADRPAGARELVIAGPLVCLGYIDGGVLAHRFRSDGGPASFRTGDVVRVDDGGNLVFAGRLDHEIKVNGIRVDAAALEHRVTSLPDVLDCRVVQDERHTVAFVRAGAGKLTDPAVRSRIESLVKRSSPAIGVWLVDRFPTKPGGKVDIPSLMDQYRATEKVGEK